MNAVLEYNGTLIREREEMLSLTDMWRAAGSPVQQTPAKWREIPGTALFAECVAENIGIADVFKTTRGRHGSTFAHWQIAFAYAKYLSHEFHAYCNTVVREHLERMREGRLPLQAQMVRRQRLHLMQICHCTYCSRYLLPNPC